jgi:hypothetical protein
MDQTGNAVTPMRASFLLKVLATSLAFVVWCSPLRGQWKLGVEVGSDRFWGGSRETTGEGKSFRPYRPTTFGVGLERQSGRLALGLRLQYAEASLALEGEGAAVAVEGVFTTVSISSEITYRLAFLGSDNQLRLHAGPLLELWDIIDEKARTRLGVQGALSLDVPLGGRFGGSVVAGAAVVPSPFERDELDPSYELRALWRRRFGVGLKYRL